MRITKIKHWKKVSKEETADHVQVDYRDGNMEVSLHEEQRAAPEFYKLFNELSAHVCKICEFADHENDRTIVTGVSIKYIEQEDGEDTIGVVFTARRKLVASPQDLSFSTPIKFEKHNDKDQTLTAECLGIVNALTAEAEEYVDGKREQIEMDLPESEDAGA
jgi:hypothetical protein